MIVRTLDASSETGWNDFVLSQRNGTFFHLCQWRRVIETVFNHSSHYLFCEQDGRIVGVLPLVHVRSRLFSNALISTPFCVYGGVLAVDCDVQQALERAAIDLAENLGVAYLEMRQRDLERDDWLSKDLYFTFRKPMSADLELNFKGIPRKQRAMIRKGMQFGLSSVVDDDVRQLYRVYSESVRNLGTPVFSRRYLRVLRESFDGVCDIVTILQNGKAVSSVMNFYFRDEVLPYYGGGTHAARSLKANDFMYWEVMRRAIERGVRLFDFGRSKVDTGSYHFKKHWGFEPQPLYYQYHLVRSKSMPNMSPANPKYRHAIAAWQRIPLWLTQWVGPWLARSLG